MEDRPPVATSVWAGEGSGALPLAEDQGDGIQEVEAGRFRDAGCLELFICP